MGKLNRFFLLFIIVLPLLAFAGEKGINSRCFMQTSDGDTINLSELCGSQPETSELQVADDVSDEQINAEYERICEVMNCQSTQDYYRALVVASENLGLDQPILQGEVVEGLDTSSVFPLPSEWQRVRSAR